MTRKALCQFAVRLYSTKVDPYKPLASFQHADLIVHEAPKSAIRDKFDAEKLKFGSQFSDHILEIEWTSKNGWGRPVIQPMHDLMLHPAAKVLHYAIELFEGLKAYRGADNKIRLFRPELNMRRMVTSAKRVCLPEFDPEELLKCMMDFVKLEQEWVPYSATSSFYLRPTMIGTDPTLGVAQSSRALLFLIGGPVSAYFPTGFKPLALFADTGAVRSWPGGAGEYKLGSNYAPTILTSKKAQDLGCQQVLWLFGEEHYLTEVGTMNIFVLMKNKNGEMELVTPPLESGLILHGITRRCLLELAREWNEFKVSERPITMKEITQALREDRVLEIFGSGTACIVAPVNKILYSEKGRLNEYYIPTMEHQPSLLRRFFDTITGIQYGTIAKPSWTKIVAECDEKAASVVAR